MSKLTKPPLKTFKKSSSTMAALFAAAICLPGAIVLAQSPTPTPTASPSPAADEAPADTGSSSLQQMVVTGSYLNSAETVGSLPVKTITRDDIDRSGAATISDLLQKVPQNGGGAFTPAVNSGLSFSPGASSIALRGLKEDATLILVNGLRMPYFPQPQNGTDSFVDINGIPLAAIDRVEILKEGASSIYGTDAIAGVVNIITKSGYSGADINTYYGNTTRKDMSTVLESLVSGYSNDKLSIMVTAEYYHQNALFAVDRPYSVTTDHRNLGLDDFRSAASSYVLLENSNGLFSPPSGNGRNLTTGDFTDSLTPAGDVVHTLNTNKYSGLSPEVQRYGFYGNFTYKIVDHLSVSGDMFFNHTRTEEQVAPSPIFDSDGFHQKDGTFVPITVGANNPFNPFAEADPFYYRVLQAGPRKTNTETYVYRPTLAFHLTDLPNNWQANLTGMTSESRSVSRGQNFLSITDVQKALNDTNPDTALNIFDTTGTGNNPETINKIKQPTEQTGLTRLSELSFDAHGDLFSLPAGPIGLAFGADYYDENYRLQPDQESLHGNIVGQGGASGFGKRNKKGIFYEISVPIVSGDWNWIGLNTLEVDTSGRLDDYTDFGSVYKPKVSILYKPLKPLSIRGSYSEGFRAPSLPELFTSAVGQYDTIIDPKFSQPYDAPITVGGNPALKPEVSYSYDLGFTLDVPYVKGLDLRADFFRIEQRNVISQPVDQFIVDNPGLFPGAITRGPTGRITNINEVYTNLGRNVVDGVDFGADYTLPTKIGTFSATIDATYNNSDETVTSPGQPNTEFIGTYLNPRFKGELDLAYDFKGFEISSTINYIGDYGDDTSYIRNVGAWTTVDLQASYEFMKDTPEDGIGDGDGKSMATGKSMKDTVLADNASGWKKWVKGLKLTVGVHNIADENPPYADATEGYDTTNANALGRFYYISLNKKF